MSATFFDKCGVQVKKDGSGALVLKVEHPLMRDAAGMAELEPDEAIALARALLEAAGADSRPWSLRAKAQEVMFVALDADGYRVYGAAGTVAHTRIELDVQLPSGSWMPVSRLHKGDRWRFRIQGKE